jgi:hypothetical protein
MTRGSDVHGVIACGLLLLLACACSRRAPGSESSSEPSGAGLSAASGTASTGGRPVLVAVELEAEDPMSGGQFVLVRNPSGTTIDLGCWGIRPDASEAPMVVPGSLSLPSGATARLFVPLADAGRVQLVDPGGLVIDGTPRISDTAHDDRIWFRTAGGWRFGRLDDPLQDVTDTTLQPPTAQTC